MMGKTKNKPLDPAPAPGGKALTHTALGLVVLTLVALGAGLGLLHIQQHQQARDRTQAQVERLAHAFAGALAGRVTRDREQLAQLAGTAPVRAGLTRDRITPGPWLADSRLTLVPDGADRETGLSFTERDLLQQLRGTGSQALSARGGDRPAVLIAQAVPGGNLVLEQDLKPWLHDLGAHLPASASLTLAQGNLTLARHGRPAADAPQAQTTAGPFTITVTMTPTPPSWLTLLPGAGLAAAILIIAIAVLLARLAQRLRGDAARLIGDLEQQARGGATPAPEPLAFSALHAVHEAQRRLVPANQRPRTAPPPATASTQPAPPPAEPPPAGPALPEALFRAYDIRGVVGDMLDANAVALLGQAIGSEAGEAGQQTVFVARDGRLSGPELMDALIRGLVASGRRVVDLGMAPVPVLYYATEVLESQTGVCLTGSHNPPEYNGLKVVIAGESLHGEKLAALRQRIIDHRLEQGQGSVEQRDINSRYLRAVCDDIVLARPMTVAVDCGNGATGSLGPALFEALGCKVVPLYTEVDGRFPHHQPDPSQPQNLAALAEAVTSGGLDLGLAFDGDGDRLGVVARDGEIIGADRLLMLFARDLLGRNPGTDVLFDVKCSRALPTLIRKQGGRPVMYKTGRPLIRERMKELGAPLAGEMSGHIFFADRWFGFDDALYAGARLLEILSLGQDDSSDVFAGLRTGVTTPELPIAVSEARKFRLMETLAERAGRFPGGRPNTVDGLRVDFPDGWGLVRASNTTPALVTRFEGRDQQALERIQALFREQLNAVDSELSLPF
jgi:phosphomannomutase/phosphoglucomutase